MRGNRSGLQAVAEAFAYTPIFPIGGRGRLIEDRGAAIRRHTLEVFKMSPGPLTSSQRGGLHFQHGARQPFTPPYGNRVLPGQRQRFNVSSGPNGSSTITLDPQEQVTVSTDADGAVVVDVTPKPENGNGNGGNGGLSVEVEASSRAASAAIGGRGFPVVRNRLFGTSGRQYAAPHQRIDITVHNDGALTLSPTDPSSDLVAVEGPQGDELTVTEVPPPELPPMPMPAP
jgi:hypothetical protein